MNLSFAGCGFLSIYHVGVAVAFKKYAPYLLLNKISGASAGAIAACCLLCDLPIGEIANSVLNLAKEARQSALGPFSPSFNVQQLLLDSLQTWLPENAHVIVSGKLHISLTRVYDGKNVIVSQFRSREDLLQALLASSFIPFFCGLLPPRFHGIRYMDGGFSDNLPTLNENTITVSPFCGESDICPRDISSQLFHVNVANTSIELSRQNIYRFTRILFPPNPEILSNMCKQGFDDALRFLHRNNLINCTRCLAVQSTFVVSDTLDESMEYDPECTECKVHRQEALVANLPETVMTLFQDAIDSANKGLINWLFKHKSVKLLSLLSLPYTLPADVVYATFTKFVLNAPKLQTCLLEMTRYFLEQLSITFPKINVYYQPMPQTIRCHLNMKYSDCEASIYDFVTDEDKNSLFKSDKNLNLTLEYNNVPTWRNCKQVANCIIEMPDLCLSDVDAFDNTCRVSSDPDPLRSCYYSNNDRIPEIYEITDEEDNQRYAAIDNNRAPFDEWDEPTWMQQHSLPKVSANSSYDESRRSLDDLSDISADDDRPEGSNIFSDPESEWAMNTRNEKSNAVLTPIPPDSRPEVDQPSLPEV